VQGVAAAAPKGAVGGIKALGTIGKAGTAKGFGVDEGALTERLQEEILTRTCSTLSSLARVALEVLACRDIDAFAAARKVCVRSRRPLPAPRSHPPQPHPNPVPLPPSTPLAFSVARC
jgi:hypothetical protein